MYKRKVAGWAKHLDFILLDVLCLQVALVIAYLFKNGSGLPFDQPEYRQLALTYAILDVLIALAFNTMHNVLKRNTFLEFVQSAKQVGLSLLGIAFYMFIVHTGTFYSRMVVLITASIHLALGFCVRMSWKRILIVRGVGNTQQVMVLVANERAVPDVLVRSENEAVRSVAFKGLILCDRNAEGEMVCGLPVLANMNNAADYLCREWVDGVYIYPLSARGPHESIDRAVLFLIEQCSEMAIPVHIRLPFGHQGSKSFTEKLDGQIVLTIASNYASSLQMALKRLMDLVGGFIGSLLAIVVMIVIGPIIKLKSPGPILFKQTRVGQNGKKFQMYKLRSMYMDAEERKKELESQNRVADGMMFKLDWDPRIIGNEIVDGQQKTGIGEFVRRSSLDEFPQFFNVLMGQMSLVGTRPPTVDEWEKYKYHHRARLAVKPGITGMWQVSGRSDITDFEEVVRLDTRYMQNWSFLLDIKIIIKTVKVVFTGRGAK